MLHRYINPFLEYGVPIEFGQKTSILNSDFFFLRVS